MLTIYKASAGSGKTFQLVLEYLKLILSGENNFRHILAVTFTNKATAEMKERIVKQLGNLAHHRQSDYLQKLQDHTGMNEAVLRKRAEKVLTSILFDYNRFSVSTIDKFTQQVLKAFNREMGINPNYRIETDSDLLVTEAIDRLISKVDKNKKLSEWLEDYIGEKIRNSENFGVETDLKKLGNELFREKLQIHLTQLGDFFADDDNIRQYLQMLRNHIYSFQKILIRMAADMVDEYHRAGMTIDDFSYKHSGIASFLENLSAGEIPESLKPRVVGAAEKPEAWATRGNAKYNEVLNLVREKLLTSLRNLIAFYNDHKRDYFTSRAIISQWYTMALLMDLYAEITDLGREKDILPIAGSNLLLRAIIDGNETPFIYEKTGNHYRHFLIDEFQDTSAMQWENFKPLISNSLAQGHSNILVGDSKQSIYRWRNSDWNILNQKVIHDFKSFDPAITALGENFRSKKEIIDFNNQFFGFLAGSFTSYEKAEPVKEKAEKIIAGLYHDLRQMVGKGENLSGGYIRIEHLGDEDEKFTERSLHRLAEQVKELYQNGYSAKDIAILVRKNVHGEMIVRFFLEIAGLPEYRDFNFEIISADSLFLKTSPAVNFIINLFRYLSGSDDPLTKAMLLFAFRNFINKAGDSSAETNNHLPQQETMYIPGRNTETEFETDLGEIIAGLKKEISILSIDEMIIRICSLFSLFEKRNELPFLQAFIDKASEIKKNMAGNIPGFLQWWDEKGQETAISENEATNAIRLLTIHKSKGLQFNAVLIPFLDWKIIERQNSIIWCEPCESPYDRVPVLPVEFSEKLANTIFRDDYYREMINVLVDNLNLIYVAFTRPVSALIINMPAHSDKGRIGTYIDNALQEVIRQPGFQHSYDDTSGTFIYGSLNRKREKSEIRKDITGEAWIFNDFSGRIKIKTRHDQFLEKTDIGHSQKNMGNIIHQILSGIKTAGDIGPACAHASASGLLKDQELSDVISQITRMAAHREAGEWFSGKWEVLTETDLLTSGETYRPDRIMISGTEAVVVDFKTGVRREDFHRQQVLRYAQILLRTGFRKVSGYLWYIRENELVRIC